MEATVSATSPLNTSNKWVKLATLVGGILAIYALYQFLNYSLSKRKLLENPANIQRTKNEENARVGREYALGRAKQNLQKAGESIPEDQRLLINYNVLGTRLVGFLGSYKYGVFDIDNAIRMTLATGSRCLILEIDRYVDSNEPVLLFRDLYGIKYSLNEGSIQQVAQNIAGRAFSGNGDGPPGNLANDPLFVVLYFRAIPPVSDITNHVKFMGKVARQLEPLRNLVIGQTPQGDFHRQGMESQLFFLPTSMFSRSIILMTNVDTSPFRNLGAIGLGGQLGPLEDLDYLVNVRLYAKDAPSPFANTSPPEGNIQPAAVLTTPEYWLTIPPDRTADAVNNTKRSWTLAMPPDADVPALEGNKTRTLFNMYGVHCYPFCFPDSVAKSNLLLAGDAPYTNTGWNLKPEALRFIPPKAIPILKPMPQMNAVGGAIPSPSL